jgi:hypothetical protein
MDLKLTDDTPEPKPKAKVKVSKKQVLEAMKESANYTVGDVAFILKCSVDDVAEHLD